MSNSKYATVSRRVLALVLDTTIVAFLAFLIGYLILRYIPGSHVEDLAFASFSIINFIVFVLVPPVLGATPSKYLLGLRILHVEEDRNIAFFQAAIREPIASFSMIIATFIVIMLFVGYGESHYSGKYDYVKFVVIWYLMNLCTMLLSKNRRALHDYIAKTIVVNKI